MNTVATKSPITAQLAELAAIHGKAAALQVEIENARTSELKSLHENFGYATPADFLAAYHTALSIRKSGKVTKKSVKKVAAVNGDRKERVTITPEKREEIKKFFKQHGTTMEAMTKFNISIATAQNIKKDAGMVNERG